MRDRFDDGDDTVNTTTTLDLSGYEEQPRRCHLCDFAVLAVGLILGLLACYRAFTMTGDPLATTAMLIGASLCLVYVTPAVLRQS